MVIMITFFAGLSILLGALVTRFSHDPEKIEHTSIALALGALLSLMIFDLVPEIFEFAEESSPFTAVLLVAVGIGFLKVLDIFVPDHEDTAENHDKENAAHIGIISSLAVILHNIVEGMTVYSLAMASLSNGIVFAVGIAMHNIPMGMLIYTTLQGKSRKEKYSLFSAVTLSTVIGGLLMRSVRDSMTVGLIGALVCVASGMIMFIVFDELLPHVLKTKPLLQSIVMTVCGFVLVWVSCQLG